jgi:hypothetical protein
MKFGLYDITIEAALTLMYIALDAQRVRLGGIPRFTGDTPEQIAEAVLRQNAGKILNAGTGHFRFMWVSDFGKAIRGMHGTVQPEYLENLIETMIVESSKRNEVPTCFNGWRGGRGFNMPYARGDSLPWLVHAIYEQQRLTGNMTTALQHRKILQKLIDKWEAVHLDDGLVAKSITGDWMDTVLRPSSTYNNLCALHMFRLSSHLGITTKTDANVFEKKLLQDRFRGSYLTDYADTERPSVDGAVIALYLGLGSPDFRIKLADYLETTQFDSPYPIRGTSQPYPKELISPIARGSAQYHSAIWLHLGLMYLNGLKLLGRDTQIQREKVDKLIMKHGTVLETLHPDGQPYHTPFHATEYGLTMAAGQYLELIKARSYKEVSPKALS